MITVITPAYNIEDYLDEAIDGVLAQTEGDFEYLIVDDGSTDRTAEIARIRARQDPRIRVIDGGHHGSSAARNLALRQVRGSFVAFCDGDDRWLPTFLERSLAVLRAAPPEVGATFCAFSSIDQQGRPWGRISAADAGDYDAERTLAGQCPQGNGSCLVLRASCFAEAGLFDENLRNCVDLDMWMRIHLESSTPLFRFVDEPLVQWRVRPGAISSSEAKRVDGLDEIFRRYGHVLTSSSIAQAYTWPAVLGFYAGKDETARRWAALVRKAEPGYFLGGTHGLVLGVFTLVGPRNGRALRSAARSAVRATRRARMAVKDGIDGRRRSSRPTTSRAVARS